MKRIRKILIPVLAGICLFSLCLAITGCQKGLAKKLDMPINVVTEIDHRKSGTKYILNWDPVEGAKGYGITIGGKTAECNETTFDATNYITPGETSFLAYVRALGNGISTGDSDVTKAIIQVQTVSPVLVFKTNEDEKSVSVLSSVVDKSQLSGTIVIPDYYNGLPVTEIGKNAFYDANASYHNPFTGDNCNDMTSNFRLPSKLEKIGDYAFAFCTKIKNINLPSTVKSIGEGSFLYCMRLTNINLSEVENFGYGAFSDCKALNTVKLSKNIQKFDALVFNETPIISNLVGDKILADYILYEVENKELEEYKVSENVTLIAGGAFMGMEKLKNLTLPENIKLGGSRIFADCEALETVNFPENLTEIADYAFYNCASIKKIELPDSVTTIGEGAFAYCTGLTFLKLPKNLTTIGRGAFISLPLETIELPDNLKYIEEEAFFDSSLTEITIPDSVKSIGAGAFNQCRLLITVNFGKGITEIGKLAFANSPISNGAILPKGVTVFNEYVFASKTVGYVVIHSRLKTIYQNAVYFKTDCPIYFEGTKEEYDQIAIVAAENQDGKSAITASNIRYYSETKPSGGTLRYWRWVDGVPTDWTDDAQ